MLWTGRNLVWLALLFLLGTSLIDAAPTRGRGLSSHRAGGRKFAVHSPPKLKTPTVKAPRRKRPASKVPKLPKTPTIVDFPKSPTGKKPKIPPTVPKKPEHLKFGADKNLAKLAHGAKNGEPPKDGQQSKGVLPGKKPRCKHPRSKHSKRVTDEECEEWDDEAPAMKTTHGAPDVAAENPGLYQVSGKWKYTDGKHKDPMNDETLRAMNKKMAENQVKHYEEVGGKGKPWKTDHPPAVALSAEKKSEGNHIVYGASNQVLAPKQKLDDNKPKLHPIMTNLRTNAKADGQRMHGDKYGLHAEEVIGSQRAHEGKEPYKDTRVVAHETLPQNGATDPIPACGRNCAKIINAGGGHDVNEGYPQSPTRTREKAEADAKKAESSKAGSSRKKQKLEDSDSYDETKGDPAA